MPGLFESIPVRSNGNSDIVEASWWNIIRSKLIAAFPGSEASDSPITILNNQSTYQDITGLLLDSTEFNYYKIRYRIERSDDTPDTRLEVGEITASWDGTIWSYERVIDVGNALGDGTELGDFGTDYLHIDSGTGQAQYKSSNMTGGTYAGSLEWKIIEVWSV